MLKVYKYPVPVRDIFQFQMPQGAVLLEFDVQREVPCLWALVEPDAPLEVRTFRFAGTGHPIETPPGKALRHVGTCQMQGGAVIWHLFEITEE